MFGFGKEEIIAKNVFNCDFKCVNCFYEFNQQFCRGIEIIQGTENVICMQGKKEDNISCPNCYSEKMIVFKRNPIKEEVRQQVVQEVQPTAPQFQKMPSYDDIMEQVKRSMVEMQHAQQPQQITNEPSVKIDKRRKVSGY